MSEDNIVWVMLKADPDFFQRRLDQRHCMACWFGYTGGCLRCSRCHNKDLFARIDQPRPLEE